MKIFLYIYFIFGIAPLFCKAQTYESDTISQYQFKGTLSEYNKPSYKYNDGELGEEERKRHSLLVYGAAYLHDSLSNTVCERRIDLIGEMVEEDFVYLVIDTMTNTFYWVDSGFEDTHERNAMFGSCRIEGEVLYLQPAFSSRTIHNNNKKTTVFNDSIGLLYAGNDLFQSNKKRIKEYKFIITEDELRNITDRFLPWEIPYKEWEEKVYVFAEDEKYLPHNPQKIMFHSLYEESFYPFCLYRIDLGTKNEIVVNQFYIFP